MEISHETFLVFCLDRAKRKLLRPAAGPWSLRFVRSRRRPTARRRSNFWPKLSTRSSLIRSFLIPVSEHSFLLGQWLYYQASVHFPLTSAAIDKSKQHQNKLSRMLGIKPGAAGWEARMLPLCYVELTPWDEEVAGSMPVGCFWCEMDTWLCCIMRHIGLKRFNSLLNPPQGVRKRYPLCALFATPLPLSTKQMTFSFCLNRSTLKNDML